MKNKNKLTRNLSERHLMMMALGGTIGTGLLLASGQTIHLTGGIGAILVYSLVALIVYSIMTSLAEMSAYDPQTGSFCLHSSKYISKSFGFAMSWNYWLNWVLVIASELIASAFIMQYWYPNVDIWVFSFIFFILIFFLNILAVRVYGESEYWLSFIKIATIIIFIFIGFLAIFRLVGNNSYVGFSNIIDSKSIFPNGFSGFLAAFLIAGYAFQGTELLGVASGETKNAKNVISSAIKKTFIRIILFYILTIIIISFLIPYNNPDLLNNSGSVSQSPFTIIFKSAGFYYLASLMNVFILTAIISTDNASLYTSSRIFWHMSNNNEAPKIFNKTTKNSVPYMAIIVSMLITGICIGLSYTVGNVIFGYILSLIGVAGYIAWFGIALSHYKFRKSYIKNGNDLKDLNYKAKFFPYSPYSPFFAMISICLIIVAIEVNNILSNTNSFSSFFSIYSGLILFILLIIGYIVFKKIFKQK